jgi:hypothetical protein
MPTPLNSNQAVDIISGTTITISSFTATGGTNRLMEVFLMAGAATPAAHNSVTWNGVALTQRGSTLAIGANWNLSRWYLKEADFPGGGGNIVGTFNAAQDEKVIFCLVSDQVMQATPYRNASQSTNTGTTSNAASVTVTSELTDLITACTWGGDAGGNITAIAVNLGTSQQEVESVAGGFEAAGCGTRAALTGSTAQSWDYTLAAGTCDAWGMLGDALLADTAPLPSGKIYVRTYRPRPFGPGIPR